MAPNRGARVRSPRQLPRVGGWDGLGLVLSPGRLGGPIDQACTQDNLLMTITGRHYAAAFRLRYQIAGRSPQETGVIDRYSRPGMKRVWSDENKYGKWLLIELAVCEAWSDEGVVPPEDMEKLRRAEYDPERLNEVLQRTRHDMTAFTRSITEGLGEEGRWLHLGLSDYLGPGGALEGLEREWLGRLGAC